MSAKTKIIVLHSKELIYTGIFVALGILLILLLVFMFLPKNESTVKEGASHETEYIDSVPVSTYVPGVYTSSIVLNNTVLNIEVAVDENNINAIRLVNLDDAVATMYPLIAPSFDDLITQIYENQSLEGVTYADDNKYTSMVLIEAIDSALAQARNTILIESPETAE